MRSRRAWTALLVVTLLGLIFDLASKQIAFEHIASVPAHVDRGAVLEAQRDGQPIGALLPRHRPVVVVPSVLEFTLVLNPGAVFGMGAGKRWFFVVFTLGAFAFAMYLFATWTGPEDRWAHASIGLLLAGGMGNLYDRLVFACVRDFIHPLPGVELPFGWTMPGGGTEIWPYVSNVADLLLIIGVVGLMVHAWRGGVPEKIAGNVGEQRRTG